MSKNDEKKQKKVDCPTGRQRYNVMECIMYAVKTKRMTGQHQQCKYLGSCWQYITECTSITSKCFGGSI